MKTLLVSLATLSLAACQATGFEQAPLAALPCDPALAGDWSSVGGDGDEDGELVLHLDADCVLSVTERKPDGPQTGESTPVHLGRHGPHAYAWVETNWLMRRFDEEHRYPDSDVTVLRYALEGDTLDLWHADDRVVAHAIIDDKLEGEVLARDQRLFNRLTGTQEPAVLDHPGFFDPEAGRFKRLRQP